MIILFIIAGIIAACIISRRRKHKPARTVTTRTTKTVYTLGTKKPDPVQMQRQAEKARAAQFKRDQAAADLIHYNQVKSDLLQAYNASGAVYGDTEKTIRKRIQYDNAIRRTEKQIEKAAYNANRGV